MRLPTPLSRLKPKVHKNQFGHVLILAGSANMLGAGALCSLSAMRSGAGLVTLAVPQSLNKTAQKKIDNTIMTLPLAETKQLTFSASSFKTLQTFFAKCQALAIGPGITTNKSTQSLVQKIIAQAEIPMVIDADALNSLCNNPSILLKSKTPKILTPHPGEMSRLTGLNTKFINDNRKKIAEDFSKKYHCTLLLKGARTVVASPNKKTYMNRSGNAGMATAGSGDVLTGMIAAFIAQGLNAFDAAKFGAYLHGKAGDLAAKKNTKTAMIASDIINFIPEAFKKAQ